MKPVFLLPAARRYWKDALQLDHCFQEMRRILEPLCPDIRLIPDGDMANVPEKMDVGILLPMSGAVQKTVLQLAQRCKTVVLYAGYCAGNFPPEITRLLLQYNAAPTLMDSWAVLRRTHPQAHLAVTAHELAHTLQAAAACDALRGSRLLRIGQTEPWVISNAASPDAYRKLGVEILPVAPEELIDAYLRTTPDQALPLQAQCMAGVTDRTGITDEALQSACRFATALSGLMDKYQAQGGAVACFDLIARTGTNACLGVAYINGYTDKTIACEGDLDSAVTMMLMRKFTRSGLWMANPCLDPSKNIQFSHCTALWRTADGLLPHALKPHHETGAGVSLDVDLPRTTPLTLGRISAECTQMTVHSGCALPGERLNVCHTQMWIRPEDYDHYLHTALGCHQVIAFEDIAAPLRLSARMLDLTLL